MGAVHRFPGMGQPEPERVAPSPAPAATVNVYDAEQARELYSTFLGVSEKAKAIVGFMRKDLAGQAGVEWTWLEITTILDSDRFKRMQDALTEAVRTGEGVTLTHEGLGKLHRLEALVSEGMQTVERWKESGGKSLALSGSGRLAQSSSSMDLVYFGSILVLGAVAITLVAVLASKSSNAASASPPLPSPHPSAVPRPAHRSSSHPFFQRMR